jgi:NAD(P)-dependent dehydrogenase (short-subunit alcohol dehydrogenase family)
MNPRRVANEKMVLVLGGSSDIGRATARRFAAAGWRIALAGRDPAALRREADDVATRVGAADTTHTVDILETGGG